MAVKDKVKGISETSKCNYDVYTSEKVDEILHDMNTYSTEETFTEKYWIDDKKIYRKCFNITQTGVSMSHNIENLKEVVGISCIIKQSNNHFCESSGVYINSNDFVLYTDETDIIFANIVFEYTKTTD